MSSLLKDLYNDRFFNQLEKALSAVYPAFNATEFRKTVYDKEWKQKELKQRVRHISTVLHKQLPEKFASATTIIRKSIQYLQEQGTGGGFEYMIFPDYVEQYGLDHFDESVTAMEFITRFISCEFAVRPFLLRYGARMHTQMLHWSLHPHEQVRRLATEGIRPRLPWGAGVPSLKKDPSPVWPVLENLKQDPSETVRRSVANNLNDISKDHPDAVLKLIKQWKGLGKETDTIIKHGCRSLLKQGHPGILKYYGLDKTGQFSIAAFRVETAIVKSGAALQFSFVLKNNDRKKHTARIEYAMYYLRKNGTHSKKVFKISERTMNPGEELNISRKQSFRPITTRVYYPGTQRVSVIINGAEQQIKDFLLQ